MNQTAGIELPRHGDIATAVRRFVGILMCFGVVLVFAASAARASDDVVPGTTEYDNVQSAIGFLRKFKNGPSKGKADLIKERLRKEKIGYGKVDGGNAETSAPGIGYGSYTTIATGFIRTDINEKTRTTPFDPDDPKGWEAIMILARILTHEMFHVEQSAVCYLRSAAGADIKEMRAWTETWLVIYSWIDELFDDYKDKPTNEKLDHLKKIAGMLSEYVGEFYGENKGFGSNWEGQTDIDAVNDLKKAIDKLPSTKKDDLDDITGKLRKVQEFFKIDKAAAYRVSVEDVSYDDSEICYDEVVTRTGTDSTNFCTYTDGSPTIDTIIPIDYPGTPTTDNTPQSPNGTPKTPTSTAPKTPATPRDVPKVPVSTTNDTPAKPGNTPRRFGNPPDKTPDKTPDKPVTDEVTTPAVPDDTPSDIPTGVQVKATDEVLHKDDDAKPIEGQTVKLFPPAKPDLPGTSQTAQDDGFDRPPAQCTTQADGNCSIDVAPEDKRFYGLPTSARHAPRNFQLKVDVPQTAGGVAETSAHPAPANSATKLPPGANIEASNFSIGDRTFTRFALSSVASAAAAAALPAKLKDEFGDAYEEDFCEDKEPGPGLAGALVPAYAPAREIASGTIRLRKVSRHN